jgi:hypothetical protein
VLFAARGITPIDLDDEEAPDPARLSRQDDPAITGLSSPRILQPARVLPVSDRRLPDARNNLFFAVICVDDAEKARRALGVQVIGEGDFAP